MTTEERLETLERELGRLKKAVDHTLEKAAGKTRIEATGFFLKDKQSRVRAAMAMSEQGPALILYDENGKTRAWLGSGQNETPEGKVTTYLESSLHLFGPDGKIIWQAPV